MVPALGGFEQAQADFDRAVARARTAVEAVVGEAASSRLRDAVASDDPAAIRFELDALDPASWDLADAISAVEDSGEALAAAAIADAVRQAVMLDRQQNGVPGV